MSRVFVIQNQHRYDRVSNKLVEKFDISPAEEFGEVVYLLGSNASPFSPAGVIEELHEGLDTFGDDDFLLLIGNPCLIGFAVAIAADVNEGRVNLLQWSGKERRYISVPADIFPDWQEP